MKHTIYITLLLLFAAVGLKAQTHKAVAKVIASDSVFTLQDSSMMRLLQTDSTINVQKKSFVGYRIQIFSGGSSKKEEAFAVKENFLELFPNERAYVVYTVPDFRVHVGNFRTKIETIELYKACLKHFPNSYPVKTEITFKDLMPEIKIENDSISNDSISSDSIRTENIINNGNL